MKLKSILLFLFSCVSLNAAHIGILIVATGRYINFVEPLITSAEKYLLPAHEKTYFIFTDGTVPNAHNVVRVYQQRLGWPYDTLMRCSMYAAHPALYTGIDYLFAMDADMLLVDTVGDEILGERVATQHPGYVGRRGTYETNEHSTACVKDHEGSCYFAGGFHGGTRDEFLKLASTMYQNIMRDLEHNFIAVWHDESHLNRYFIDNVPTIILNPSYCYPGNKRIAYPKKLVALDKNHAEYRK
jgi:histo-blood group ABO system transferase